MMSAILTTVKDGACFSARFEHAFIRVAICFGLLKRFFRVAS